jgi:hypothetical protein
LLNDVNSLRNFCTAGESTVSCSPVSIVDDLPNSQNEWRITPEDYVRLYNEECIWRLFRGAAYGIITTQNQEVLRKNSV